MSRAVGDSADIDFHGDIPGAGAVFGQADHYRFILHDRDAIFSPQLDAPVARMGLEVIKTRLIERLRGFLRSLERALESFFERAFVKMALRSFIMH